MDKATPNQIKTLREEHELTQAQFGALAGTPVQAQPTKGELYRSRTVQEWERKGAGMPFVAWDLVNTKLLLRTLGLAELPELMERPLHEILRPILQRCTRGKRGQTRNA